MNSMTGYGRATAHLGSQAVAVQVSSVNRRGLDLTMKLPDEWQGFEAVVSEAVRGVATRGKVHVAIEVDGNDTPGAAWDERELAGTLENLRKFARARKIPFEPSAELLWQIASAQRIGTKLPADDATAKVILKALQEALRGFSAMRAREGEALLVDFLRRIEKLHTIIETVAQRAPRVPGVYREQLMARLRQAGLELDVADERVLKEVALFADRSDVTEEITRLRSHLIQFKELLRGDGEVGRKAEFLLQEMGREIHTIGSKANDLSIAQQVIEFKNELERVREQMANVE
ncbi:MAG TPA: YicC/YloC family endoribonuclease [Lacunisphaera sp.]|jgi:uncharacterized protein (TIGR00255 family)|nr:YicC/YloC family endoribonuclease [Lacunisphaera sp.]